MTLIRVLRCDNPSCLNDHRSGIHDDGFPPGWYQLRFYDDGTISHFCSWPCVIKGGRADG